jgi:hypothetical protein
MAMYGQNIPNVGARRNALDQMAGSRAMSNMAGPGRMRRQGAGATTRMDLPRNRAFDDFVAQQQSTPYPQRVVGPRPTSSPRNIDPLFGVPMGGPAAMPAYGQPGISNLPMPRGEGARFGAGRAQKSYAQLDAMSRNMPGRMGPGPLPVPGRMGGSMPSAGMAAGPSDMAMVRLRELLMKRPTRGFIR